MARLPTDLVLRTVPPLQVSDRTVRLYTFEFPVTDAAQVRVSHNGTVLEAGSQYTVIVRDDGTGGQIDLLDPIADPDAVTLLVNDVIDVWRDTTITGTPDLVQGTQELADRPALTEDDVRALVRASVADWAQAGTPDSIPPFKLTNAAVAALGTIPASIQEALNVRSVSLVGADLVGTSPGGHSMSVDLIPAVRAGVHDWAEFDDTTPIPSGKLANAPGLDQTAVDARVSAGVQDWAEDGNTDPIPASKLVNADRGIDVHEEGSLLGRVTDLDFRGMDFTMARVGTTGTLTLVVPPRGLSQTEVEMAIATEVATWARTTGTGRLFDAGLGNVEVTEEATGWAAQYELPPVVWHLDRAHTYDFPVSRSAGLLTATVLGSPATFTGVPFPSDSVDVSFSHLSYDPSGNTFSLRLTQGSEIARFDGYAVELLNTQGTTSRFLFADLFEAVAPAGVPSALTLTWRNAPPDTVDAGNCEMRVLRPVAAVNYVPTASATDLADWVLTLNSVKEPIWKVAPAGQGGTGGLTQTQVDNRINLVAPGLIEDWAEVANASTLIPDSKIPAGIARDTEIPSDTDIDNRIATWARANSPTGTIPDNRVPATIARDTEIATWARSTGPTGRIPAARALAPPANAAEITGGVLATVRSWSSATIRQAINAVVPTWIRTTTAKVPAAKLPDTVTKSDAEMGTATDVRSWTAERVGQAIAAQVQQWALDTTTAIPTGKLSVVQSWARDTTTAIPAAKLANAPGGLTVQDSGTRRGTADTVDTINFNDNLTVSRSGTAVTVNGAAGGVSSSAARLIAQNVVANWAEEGNGDPVPLTKLPGVVPNTEASGGVATTVRSWTAAQVRRAINAVVQPFARIGDTTSLIPQSKLTNASNLIAVWARQGNTANAVPDGKLPALATESEVQVALASPGTARRLFSVQRIRQAINFIVQDWARDTTTQIPASKLMNAPGGATAGSVKGVGALPAASGRALRDLWLAPDGLYERTVTAGSNTLNLKDFVSNIAAGTDGNSLSAGWQRSGVTTSFLPAGDYGTLFEGLPSEVVAFVAYRQRVRSAETNVRYYLLLDTGTDTEFFGSSLTITVPGGSGTTGDNPATITLNPQTSLLFGYPWYQGIVTGGTVGALQSVFGPLDSSVTGTYTITDNVTLTAQSGNRFGGGIANWSLRIPERPSITARGPLWGITRVIDTAVTDGGVLGSFNAGENAWNETVAGETVAPPTGWDPWNATSGILVYLPPSPPDGCTGLFIVVEEGGVERAAVYIPYGVGLSTDAPPGTTSTNVAILRGRRSTFEETNVQVPASNFTDAVMVQVTMTIDETNGRYNLTITGDRDPGTRGFAANTRFKIYAAGAFIV